jgi:hypothetical protein
MPAHARIAEVTAIGRILAEYHKLEIDLLHCVANGISDFDHAFKTMFGQMGASPRINAACDLGRPAYQALKLETDFDLAIDSMRHAMKIRHRYAHWTWWDDNSGQLAIANLEDLAKEPGVVRNFDGLRIHHVDMPLLRQQQEFFVYVDHLIAWLNYEGRHLTGKLQKNPVQKPSPIAPPALTHEPP